MTLRLAAVLLVVTTVPGACGRGPAAGARSPLRVFAAASLTDAFRTLEGRFESRHPAVDVRFNFGGSSSLAQQIDAGAAADVFVAADHETVQRVVEAGHAHDPIVIARNRLSIIVEPGNPRAVRRLEHLSRGDLVVVLCAPEVPCGRLAAAALEHAGVDVDAASLEENVKAVVSKVTLGEADAGIVYATDVVSAGAAAEGVPLDGGGAPELQAVYPAVATTAARNEEAAAAWIAFLQSTEARRVFESFGFLAAA